MSGKFRKLRSVCLMFILTCLVSCQSYEEPEVEGSCSPFIDSNCKWQTYFEPVHSYANWKSGSSTCGLLRDGKLMCRPVSDVDKYLELAPENQFVELINGGMSCALSDKRQVFCWSRISYKDISDPIVEIPPVANFLWKTIATSSSAVCGIPLARDGIWCWGNPIGDLRTTEATAVDVQSDGWFSPVQVTDGTWSQIAIQSKVSGFNYSRLGFLCGIKGQAQLFCFELGHTILGPKLTLDVPQWVSLFVVNADVCGLTKTGTLECYEICSVGDIDENRDTCFSNEKPVASTEKGPWITIASYQSFGSFMSSDKEAHCGVKADHSLWCRGTISRTGKLYSSRKRSERKLDWESVEIDETGICAVKTNGKMYCLPHFGDDLLSGPPSNIGWTMVDSEPSGPE